MQVESSKQVLRFRYDTIFMYPLCLAFCMLYVLQFHICTVCFPYMQLSMLAKAVETDSDAWWWIKSDGVDVVKGSLLTAFHLAHVILLDLL